VLTGGGGQPTVVTLKPAEAAAIDTYLAEDAPTTNYATNSQLYNRVGVGVDHTVMIKFDLSSIPAGSTIVSATLNLWSAGNQTANRTMGVYPILAANSAWTEDGATWNTLDGTNPWAGDTAGDGGEDAGCSVAGTDYGSTAIGSLFYPANAGANYKFSTSLTVAAVQAWLDGDNYGFRLGLSNLTIHSSSVVNAIYCPELAVSYFPT